VVPLSRRLPNTEIYRTHTLPYPNGYLIVFERLSLTIHHGPNEGDKTNLNGNHLQRKRKKKKEKTQIAITLPIKPLQEEEITKQKNEKPFV